MRMKGCVYSHLCLRHPLKQPVVDLVEFKFKQIRPLVCSHMTEFAAGVDVCVFMKGRGADFDEPLRIEEDTNWASEQTYVYIPIYLLHSIWSLVKTYIPCYWVQQVKGQYDQSAKGSCGDAAGP